MELWLICVIASAGACVILITAPTVWRCIKQRKAQAKQREDFALRSKYRKGPEAVTNTNTRFKDVGNQIGNDVLEDGLRMNKTEIDRDTDASKLIRPPAPAGGFVEDTYGTKLVEKGVVVADVDGGDAVIPVDCKPAPDAAVLPPKPTARSVSMEAVTGGDEEGASEAAEEDREEDDEEDDDEDAKED